MYSLGELRILGRLDQDVMAQRYAAEDPEGHPVILTVGVGQLYEGEPVAFLAWAERLAECSSHPHLAEVCAFGVVEDKAHLAVRTGAGHTLAELQARGEPIDPEQLRLLGAALADGLAAAHEAGLVHLAIRSEVVFVADDERPVIVGFEASSPGMARPVTHGPRAAPEYRTPRGVLDGQGQSSGAPADVYALAVLLYQALGGRLPWLTDATGDAVVDGALRAVPLPDIPGVRAEVVDVLRRAVAVHPAQRISAAALRDGLLAPGQPARRTPLSDDGAAEMLSATPALVLPTVPPTVPAPSPGRKDDADDVSDSRAGVFPDSRETSVRESDHSTITPLVGSWQVASDIGAPDLLVVDQSGEVVWTGSDEHGPFMATGRATPLGDGIYQLSLREPAGQAGFAVDLRLEAGGLTFVVDEGPGDDTSDADQAEAS